MRFWIVALILVAAGCTSTHHGGADAMIMPAIDTPTHFLVIGKDGKTQEPAPGPCRNPMIDPRDGTRIVLERTSNGRGYYRVPAGRYGVRSGELLLIECETGRVMGIVKR